MRPTRPTALLLVAALVGSGCVGVESTTRTWSEPPPTPPQELVWYGQVSQVRETVVQYRGDPAAGAFAGAVVGGLLGSAISHGHGGGFFGAMTGSMIGAEASRGGPPQWRYDVTVRFDDGSLRTYVYEGWCPFRVGERVVLSSSGLARE
jgi:outer membrane lipoprotein SlyB